MKESKTHRNENRKKHTQKEQTKERKLKEN
jgi:hypothetical protein